MTYTPTLTVTAEWFEWRYPFFCWPFASCPHPFGEYSGNISNRRQFTPGYIITNAEVFDKDAYGEYGKLAPDAIAKYGGEFLTRGGAAQILEGNWEPHRIVVVKFDSVEQAKAMYNSPEYQAAKEKRIGAADFNMIVVEGN